MNSDYSLFKEHSVPTVAGRWPTTAFPEKRLQPLAADALVIQSCTPQPPKQDCAPRLGSRIISRSVRLSTGVIENLFKTFLTRSHPLNWREQNYRLIDSGFL